MKKQSDRHQMVATFNLLGFICATGRAGCTWDEFKESGYEVMQKHRTQRCFEDRSRQLSDCVTQQSYDSYERE